MKGEGYVKMAAPAERLEAVFGRLVNGTDLLRYDNCPQPTKAKLMPRYLVKYKDLVLALNEMGWDFARGDVLKATAAISGSVAVSASGLASLSSFHRLSLIISRQSGLSRTYCWYECTAEPSRPKLGSKQTS